MSTSNEHKDDICCELSDGDNIPLIKPSSYSSKIKSRHVVTAVKKYLSIDELSWLLDRGKRVLCIRNIHSPTTVEEELLALTHRVIVVEKDVGVHAECIAPVDESGLFVQYAARNGRTSSSRIYRGAADDNGFVLLSFSYSMGPIETQVIFDVWYIDVYSLHTTKHKESIMLDTKHKFKFNIMLKSGWLCILWPFHKLYSVLNFTQSPPLPFIQYPIDEDLEEFYVAMINGHHLSLTLNNNSFDDDVFFDSVASKRDTVYYCLKTGSRYSSKVAMQKMSKLLKIQHPLDVVFINMPNKPMWMVTECLPSEMSLIAITFFSEVEADDEATQCIKKRLDLNHLFTTKHDSFFQTPNQYQINFVICKIQWHVFLWISKRHILRIDLNSLKPSAILEMQTNSFDDYKNELNEFTMKMSLNKKDINVFVKDRKCIMHFETFCLPQPISLKQLTKYEVMKYYPKSTIEKLLTKSVFKKELLAAY